MPVTESTSKTALKAPPKVTITPEKNAQSILRTDTKDRVKDKVTSVAIKEPELKKTSSKKGVNEKATPKERSASQAKPLTDQRNDQLKASDSKELVEGDIEKVNEFKENKFFNFDDTCPHLMWKTNPAERNLADHKGKGSPWYEPHRRREDIEREEEERKEIERKNIEARLKEYKHRQKKKQNEEKERKKKEKEKEEKENKKKEKERQKMLKTGNITPSDSAYYEPCPHRSWKPEKKKRKKDDSSPRGAGTPWYEPVRKKEDIDKEAEEKRIKEYKKDSKKRKEAYEKREEERKKKEKKKAKGKEEKESGSEDEEEEEEKDPEEEKEKEEARLKGLRKKYKGAMSSMYDPCPHKVWNPKKENIKEEVKKATPRGAGTPWYEPTRKKEDVDKELEKMLRKQRRKEFKERKEEFEKRLQEKDEKLKVKQEEDKKKKEEEEEREEKEREKQEKRKKRRKEKADEKRREQKEQRKKDREQAKQEEETEEGEEEKEKKKFIPGDSSQYDPCPHKVFHPEAGKKSMHEPRGVGSPWYETTRKKVDVDKEEEEKNKKQKEKEYKKGKEDYDKRKKEKEEQTKDQREAEEKKKEKEKKKKEKKREEAAKNCKPGMSYMYDPCPHGVWTPKPGEKDLSAPSGFGSPWYEPVKTKKEKEKEEEDNKKKEDEASQKRKANYDKRQQEKNEKEKKEKEEEEKKKKEQEKADEENKKKKEEQKKKKEEKQQRKQEKRRKEREEREKKEKEEGKDKKKDVPVASYELEPCPHKVYTPMPGEKDKAEPKGVGAPWYVATRKKEDIDKEEEEKQKEENKRRKEKRKKREQELQEKEKEEKEKETELKEKEEERIKSREDRRAKLIERRNRAKEIEDEEHEEMGQGVRSDKADFSLEIISLMDFMKYVDKQDRQRKGEELRRSKEEIEDEIMADAAKEAFVNDFRGFVQSFIEAEWGRADKRLKKLERQEKRRRKELLSNMDPLAKDMIEEGNRFTTLYNAAMGKKKRGNGENMPSATEDMMVGMIMQQMDTMYPPAFMLPT